MMSSNKKRKQDHTPSVTRKLAQASRTLKACDNCRKQKTRCFKSPENPNSCVRCNTLNKSCSFGILNFQQDYSENKSKLDLIYDGINEVLGILKSTSMVVATPISNSTSIDEENSNEYVDNSTRFQSRPSSFITSPFSIISNSISNVPAPIQNLLNLNKSTKQVDDVISLGRLTESETISLIDEFRREFGKWISLPHNISTTTWINRIKTKSSLLLTTCCCIMIGKTTSELPRALCNKLIQDLNQTIPHYSCYQTEDTIEFLQAVVLLSTYSISISCLIQQVDAQFTLDSWILSQIGLTNFISSSTFGHLKTNDEDMILTQLRVYNHLCLTHLFYCMISGRMCILDEIRINQCYGSLSLLNATNFDGRMVSEINMIVIAYTFFQLNNDIHDLSDLHQNLTNVKQEIKLWYQQWEYLFSQPTIQFVELNYHFCNLLVYYGYEYKRQKLIGNEFVFMEVNLEFLKFINEITLIEMFDHAYCVVKEINHCQNDDSFAYLSDQVHFCFYFSALCLIGILYQFKSAGNEQVQDEENVLQLINVLIDKFTSISKNNHNVLFKYKCGIESVLQKYFP